MTKREQWEWIKKNDPVLMQFLLDAKKYFGKPDVKIEINPTIAKQDQ